MNFEVAPLWSSIKEDLRALQASIGCPDDFIVGMLQNIACDWEM